MHGNPWPPEPVAAIRPPRRATEPKSNPRSDVAPQSRTTSPCPDKTVLTCPASLLRCRSGGGGGTGGRRGGGGRRGRKGREEGTAPPRGGRTRGVQLGSPS